MAWADAPGAGRYAIVSSFPALPYTRVVGVSPRRVVPPRRAHHRARQRSPTRSRTSSSSRCRRCSRCCAPSSTCRGRCWACSSARSMPPAASRSSPPASSSIAPARVPSCSPGSRCSPAGRCWPRSPRRPLALPDRRRDGRRQRRLPSCRLRDPQRQRGAAQAGLRLFDPRRRRQPGLCAVADRELRAGLGLRLARRAGRDGLAGPRRARRARDPARTAHVAQGARRPRALAARIVSLFLQPAIALCFCYFVAQTMASVGLQTFLPAALNAGLAVPLALADDGGHGVSAGGHRRHRGRRLLRHAHDAARPGRGDRAPRGREPARARGDRGRAAGADDSDIRAGGLRDGLAPDRRAT